MKLRTATPTGRTGMNINRTEEDLAVETGYEVLYEDDWFLIVEKPSPLPVHAVGRFKQKNLLSLMQKDRGIPAGGLRIVNRLDSETSGLVIVAKSSEAAGKLGILFERREVDKEYHAVVFGIPDPREGMISIALGSGRERSHHIRIPDAEGQSAFTYYEVLKNTAEFSLLKLTPQTGRTHQIRAHLAFLGHPIAGDKIYIDPAIFERYIHEGWQEDMRPVVKARRLLLHANRLEFRHPETGQMMRFTSPIPACFEPCLNF